VGAVEHQLQHFMHVGDSVLQHFQRLISILSGYNRHIHDAKLHATQLCCPSALAPAQLSCAHLLLEVPRAHTRLPYWAWYKLAEWSMYMICSCTLSVGAHLCHAHVSKQSEANANHLQLRGGLDKR
jgi:hypothetical protein